MNSLISIVIPVYNVVRFLQDCVKSIQEQSYQNFEIILVDDGSSDGSSALCDSLARLDNRIVVVHQPNSGVSHARNKGIEISTGQYIMFMDSDDWLETNALESLLQRLNETGADVCFANKYYKDADNIEIATTYNCAIKQKTSLAVRLHLDHGFISSPCFSLARNDKKVFFDADIHIMEDWEYNFRLLSLFKSFVMYDKPFYHYRTVASSASQSPINSRKLSCFLIPNKVDKFLEEHNLNYPNADNKVMVFLVYMMLVNYTSSGCDTVDDYKKIKLYSKKVLSFALFNKETSLNNKLSVLLGAISPKLFAFLFNLKYGK